MKEIKLYIRASYIIFNFVKWEMNMIGCLQVVRIYSFMKEIKLYIRASYIVFLFFKTENIIILQKTTSRVFTDLLSNSPKHSSQFSPGYEGMDTMYYLVNTK